MLRIAILTMVLATAATAQQSNTEDSVKEALWLGLSSQVRTITLRVTSTGCTRKEDFVFEQDSDGVINVKRTRKDRCKKRAEIVEFEFSVSELSLRQPMYLKL